MSHEPDEQPEDQPADATPPPNETKAEKARREDREAMAAAVAFLSGSAALYPRLTIQAVADGADLWPRTVGRRYKGPKGLRLAALKYVAESSNPRRDIFDDVKAGLLTGEPLDQALTGVVAVVWRQVMEDPLFRLKIMAWPAIAGDEGGETRKALRPHYAQWDEASGNVIDNIARKIGCKLRPGIEDTDVSILATALMEGLAIRGLIDPESIPEDLPGKGLIALFECALDLDGTARPFGETLNGIEITEDD